MKHLGLVHITLILVVGALLLGVAAGNNGLTAYQSLMPPSAEVGQMVTVTVSLTYNGQNSIQATVSPRLPPGVAANNGEQSLELFPGQIQQASYSFAAEQSGSYLIASDISYSENDAPRSLRLEAPFTATESQPSAPQLTQPYPGGQPSGAFPGPGCSTIPNGPDYVQPGGPGDDNQQPSDEEGHNPSGEPPAEPQPDGDGGPAGDQ